ncbi:MAG: hypothetical protein K5637_00690 [Lachnospiraceae bacterium]|nr:hypothetical protein [Lachnospiraceae bacterium]
MGETAKAIGGLIISAAAIYGAIKYVIKRWKEEKPELMEKINSEPAKKTKASKKE